MASTYAKTKTIENLKESFMFIKGFISLDHVPSQTWCVPVYESLYIQAHRAVLVHISIYGDIYINIWASTYKYIHLDIENLSFVMVVPQYDHSFWAETDKAMKIHTNMYTPTCKCKNTHLHVNVKIHTYM